MVVQSLCRKAGALLLVARTEYRDLMRRGAALIFLAIDCVGKRKWGVSTPGDALMK